MKIIFNILLTILLFTSDASAQPFSTPRGSPATVITTSQRYNNDVNACFGTSNNACIQYDTAVTPDTWIYGIGADSKNVLFCDKADMNTDWNKALSTDPTLCVQSADQTTTTDRICLSHNETDAVLSSDGGNIILDPASTQVKIGGTGDLFLEDALCTSTNPCISNTSGFNSGFSVDSSGFGYYIFGSVPQLSLNNQLFETAAAVSFALDQQLLTAGTMTGASTANVRSVWHRYNWTNAMVVALGGVTLGDVAVATLPAKTIVTNAYVVISTACTGPATLTVAFGRTAALYIDYIVASDAKAAANTVYGDASGERGSNLTSYDLPSYTGTTSVNAHFISTGANLNTVTTCTGAIYVETAVLP